jgi:hypothetical protein
MNLFNIERSYNIMKTRGWDKIFVFVDIHETMLKPNWNADTTPHEWFPYAEEVMREMSDRKDMCLILYTCSTYADVEKYLAFFEQHGVVFEHVNCNPQAASTDYACFDDKPYFNVMLDDKAGFEASLDENGVNDWLRIKEVLRKLPELVMSSVN